MPRFILLFFGFILFHLLFQQCANPSTPTGGPKDTIPPTLIKSFPENGTINFSGQQIRLEFSEFINVDKLKQQLIITPRTNITYKAIVKKRELIINFNKLLNDSTTYNINFANSVTDITEKNPVINLFLSFSTGPFIDSMSIKGNVIDLFKQTPAVEYTVALYPDSDTLDYFTHLPIYFTTTKENGSFQLDYLKSNKYRILAFKDSNKNILLDPETEAHGFLKTVINLDSIIELTNPIRSVLQNVKPLTLISSRPIGPYIEVKYNKTIDNYLLTPTYLHHNIIGKKQNVIRIYKPEKININDSLRIIIQAQDSLTNQIIDTLKTKFLESNRKISPISYNVSSKTETLQNNHVISIQFNKPIIQYDSTKLYFSKDSSFLYKFKPKLEWNHNFTKLKIATGINKEKLINELKKTIPEDTIPKNDNNPLKTDHPSTSIQTIDLLIEAGAFISIENDSSEQKEVPILLNKSDSYGTIRFSIETEYKSFTVQLLNNQQKVSYQKENDKQFVFKKINPGNYDIRVLIDNNNDSKWSAGNLLLNMEPEKIYLHPGPTSIRENWVIDIDLSF